MKIGELKQNPPLYQKGPVEISGRIKGPITRYRSPKGLLSIFKCCDETGEINIIFPGLMILPEGSEITAKGRLKTNDDLTLESDEIFDHKTKRTYDITHL
jgi:hypothetical protein